MSWLNSMKRALLTISFIYRVPLVVNWGKVVGESSSTCADATMFSKSSLGVCNKSWILSEESNAKPHWPENQVPNKVELELRNKTKYLMKGFGKSQPEANKSRLIKANNDFLSSSFFSQSRPEVSGRDRVSPHHQHRRAFCPRWCIFQDSRMQSKARISLVPNAHISFVRTYTKAGRRGKTRLLHAHYLHYRFTRRSNHEEEVQGATLLIIIFQRQKVLSQEASCRE